MKNFKEISTRLEIAKKNIKRSQIKKGGANVTSYGKALKISTELVAAVVVGTTMGYILDSWFDTKPLLIICFFLIFFFAISKRVDISLKSFIIYFGFKQLILQLFVNPQKLVGLFLFQA